MDRIWYSTDKKMICSQYGVIEDLRDAHVPVFGSFQVEIDKIDEEKKERVCQEVFKRMSAVEGDEE